MENKSDIRFQAGQATGQAQVKKDEVMDKARDTCQQGKEKASGFVQQTGEQMKSMANSAADTVKNAVGMDGSHTSTTTTTTKHH